MHMDLCGPFRTQARGGYRYVLVLVDDTTRQGFVYLLREKSEAQQYIQLLILQIEKQYPGREVRVLRSDGGGEFMGKSFQQWLGSKGITQTDHGTLQPQQNGVAERRNATLLDTMRTLLAWSRLRSGGGRQSWLPMISTTIYPLLSCQRTFHPKRPGQERNLQ